MIHRLIELANFHAQKHHVGVQVLQEDWSPQLDVKIWLPLSGEETVTLEGLEFSYHPDLGKDEPWEVINIHDRPMLRIGQDCLCFLFSPGNEQAEKLVRELIDKYLPSVLIRYRRIQRDQFLQQLTGCVSDRRDELESQIHSDKYEIQSLGQKIVELSRKVTINQHTLKFFEQSSDKLKRQAVKLFADLNRLVPGLYSKISFEGMMVRGVTRDITIEYEDENYYLRPYTVSVDLRMGKVQIEGDSNENNGYIHPHITNDPNGICWGNIGGIVPKLIGEMDLHGLFQLIHTFLSTYNPDDSYQKIQYWDPNWEGDEDEPFCVWCESYGHEASECDACWWCDDCDEFHSVDARCPHEEAA